MAQWISLSEAAFQYGVNEADIRLWIEKREVTFVPVGTTYVVDDESIQELLSHYQVIPTHDYIFTLKSMYENQFLLGESYLEIIHMEELKVIRLEEEISLMKSMQDMMSRNIELYKKIIRMLKNDSPIEIDFFAKLWKKLKCTLRIR